MIFRTINKTYFFTVFMLSIFGLTAGFAQEHGENPIHEIVEEVHELEAEEGFKAGDYIIHHISDSHSIHFFGKESEGIPEVSIPLPVILWTNNGLSVFMS